MLTRLSSVIVCIFLLGCTGPDTRSIEERTVILDVRESDSVIVPPPSGPVLKLVTLNLAHGRKDGLNQWLVSTEQTRQNLDEIAAYLRDVGADVVALQEADGPSRWSGGFDHVAYLAEKGGFKYNVYAEHAQISMGNYGTAILSKWPITEALGFTYPDSPPTASKGFTLANIAWRGADETTMPVDVISVHLDFSRKSVRLQQIDELTSVLNQRNNAVAIMGDFNSEWLAGEYLVQNSADTHRLHVYQPGSDQLNTYKNKRLDWILLSHNLIFESYEVEQRLLSDHKAVVANITRCSAETEP